MDIGGGTWTWNRQIARPSLPAERFGNDADAEAGGNQTQNRKRCHHFLNDARCEALSHTGGV
jgi:hypothetical protein